MKKLVTIIVLCMTIGVVKSNAQGLGLPDLTQINKTYELSNYQTFQANGSNYMQLETIWIDLLKLPSITTFGGFSVLVEKCTDMTTKKVAKAIRFRANASTGVGKLLSGGIGAQSHPDFYVDQTEVPALLAKLKEFQAMSDKPTNFTCSYNYICKGGFVVTVGYRKAEGDKKDSAAWMGSIGSTGDMLVKDVFAALIKILETSNEQLQKM